MFSPHYFITTFLYSLYILIVHTTTVSDFTESIHLDEISPLAFPTLSLCWSNEHVFLSRSNDFELNYRSRAKKLRVNRFVIKQRRISNIASRSVALHGGWSVSREFRRGWKIERRLDDKRFHVSRFPFGRGVG